MIRLLVAPHIEQKHLGLNLPGNVLVSNQPYALKTGDAKRFIRGLEVESIDLTISSPPYFIGKPYDDSRDVDGFIKLHEEILPSIVRATKNGGSICWQVGYHAIGESLIPLDFIVHQIMSVLDDVRLQNRIIWTFGHGNHSKKRFSMRHEVVLWYSKGNKDSFNLDNVRVSQKYPGKKHYKGPNKGQYSGNPLGKNPGDVWEIPNLKSNHIERTDHPCQFPIALPRRLIRALTNKNDLVLDPFMGAGTVGVAALLESRKFIGFDKEKEYVKIARKRCRESLTNLVQVRPDVPVSKPDLNTAVARTPEHFLPSEGQN